MQKKARLLDRAVDLVSNMPLALQAALGFLQAIHYSAKAASANRDSCCSLSRVVGRIRPLLEEIEFGANDDATEMRERALEMVATSLEKAHVAVVRFSTMGNLQAILETEAMVSQFVAVCSELEESLRSLGDVATGTAPEWKEDLERISGQLQSVNFESCSKNRNTMRQVRQQVLRMQGKRTVSKPVYSKICSLLWRCQLPEKLDMTHELQGLRRELSRAKAEKDTREEYVLQQVIRALQSSAAVPFTSVTPVPQPPVEYCCPISQNVMSDPVVLVETGQTYDRKCIEEWFSRGKVTCPVTGQRLSSTQLTPNFALKSLASTWLQVHNCEEAQFEGLGEGSSHGSDDEAENVDDVSLEVEAGIVETAYGGKRPGVNKAAQQGYCGAMEHGKGDYDAEIPSKHAGLLSRIGNLLEKLKQRRAQQDSNSSIAEAPDLGDLSKKPEPMQDSLPTDAHEMPLKPRARPDSATSISMFKLEKGPSFPVTGTGSELLSDSDENDGTAPSELKTGSAARVDGDVISALPEGTRFAPAKQNARPDSATSMQLSLPDNVVSYPISEPESELLSDSEEEEVSLPALDGNPVLRRDIGMTPDSNYEPTQYRAQSVESVQTTLEQSASKLVEHCRRHSWSGELPKVVSQFQQVKQAGASASRRLELLTMALNASRQSLDVITPRNGQQRTSSDEQNDGKDVVVETASCSSALQTQMQAGLPAAASPAHERTRHMSVMDPSGSKYECEAKSVEPFHGQILGEDASPNMHKWREGGTDPVAHLLEDIGGESDDFLDGEDSVDSDSDSVCTDISKLLMCPFTKDFGEVDSADLTGSGQCDSTDWDGASLETENESTASNASGEYDEDVQSLGKHSLSSLSTVASGGAAIVPVAMRPVKRSKKSPGIRSSSVLGCMDGTQVADASKSSKATNPVLLTLLGSGSVEVAMTTAVELCARAKKNPVVQEQLLESGVIPCLVEKLQSPKRDARISAARALALLGDCSTDLQLEIVAAGAIPLLSQLTRSGSRRTGEAAGWAMSRLTTKNASSVASTPDVSIPLLVDMVCSESLEVKSSAVLELSRVVSSVVGGYKEIGQAGVIRSLVELLSSDVPAVHQAAGELLASLVNKNREALQSLVDTEGIALRLLQLIRTAPDEGKTAAAQVLKTLVDSSENIQHDITQIGGVHVLVTLLKVGFPGNGGREAAAWMLGSLASQSRYAYEQMVEHGAVAVLENLTKEGEAEEQVAASWALQQAFVSEDAELSGLSIPVIIRSLESGTPEAKIVAAWELCHLSSSNFWVQQELLHSDAVQVLLDLLKTGEPVEAMNAALAALLHLGPALETVPADVCRRGGIPLLVSVLKEHAEADRKLVTELLALLSDSCLVHQQEVLSAGAVPLLVHMIRGSESVCLAAKEVLMKLIDSELTAISSAVSTASVSLLLEIVKADGSQSYSREAAVALLNRMIEINFDSRQTVVDHGGMPLLLGIMNTGENLELKSMAANAVTKLAASNGKVQDSLAGSGAFGTLVQVLESTSARIREGAAKRSGMGFGIDESKLEEMYEHSECVKAGASLSVPDSDEGMLLTTEENTPLLNSPTVGQTPTGVPVHRGTAEKGNGDRAAVGVVNYVHQKVGQDLMSEGLGCFVSSKSQDVPKQMISNVCHDSVGNKCVSGALHTPLVTDSRPVETEEGHAQEERPVISQLVEMLRCGHGDDQDTASSALRSLATGNKAEKLELLNAGAVPLLVEILQSKSFQ